MWQLASDWQDNSVEMAEVVWVRLPNEYYLVTMLSMTCGLEVALNETNPSKTEEDLKKHKAMAIAMDHKTCKGIKSKVWNPVDHSSVWASYVTPPCL